MNGVAAAHEAATSVLLVAIGAIGCSKERGFHLQGAVTHKGQPVPVGDILFSPDTSRGNRGAGVMASIQDGRYETLRSKGHAGGPHVLTINGFDGKSDPKIMLPNGNLLFHKYQLRIDLPKESSSLDIDVPGEWQ